LTDLPELALPIRSNAAVPPEMAWQPKHSLHGLLHSHRQVRRFTQRGSELEAFENKRSSVFQIAAIQKKGLPNQ